MSMMHGQTHIKFKVESYVYWTVHYLTIVDKENQLDVTLFSLFLF
jgi:hypothetical protein